MSTCILCGGETSRRTGRCGSCLRYNHKPVGKDFGDGRPGSVTHAIEHRQWPLWRPRHLSPIIEPRPFDDTIAMQNARDSIIGTAKAIKRMAATETDDELKRRLLQRWKTIYPATKELLELYHPGVAHESPPKATRENGPEDAGDG